MRKERKYRELSVSHNFVPVVLETLGAVGLKFLAFLRELWYRLTRATEDYLGESAFLFQRLSVQGNSAIYNAVCVAGRPTFDGNQLIS